MLAVGTALFLGARSLRLLPPWRPRAVPWNGPEVILAFLAFWGWPALWYHVLGALGWRTGPPGLDLLRSQLLAFPCVVATILLLCRSASGTRPADLGLTVGRVGPDLLAAVIGAAVLTPLANLLNIAAAQLLSEAEPHPLQRLAEGSASPAVWVMLVASATVAAPVMEELLFRGLLLGWLEKQPSYGPVVLGLALAFALTHGWTRERSVGEKETWYKRQDAAEQEFTGTLRALGEGAERHYELTVEGKPEVHRVSPGPEEDLLTPFDGRQVHLVGKVVGEAVWPGRITVLDPPWPERPAPVVFVLLMVPGYFVFPWLVRRWLPDAAAARAVYAGALLFGAIHGAWPSGVPLFVLGLGLGFLAVRTRSLVGPIVLHGLFNGVACVLLALGYGEPTPPPTPEKGSPTTSALLRPPPSSTSTAVPGSWCPRRR
jgi:membrane protease YdiL (CAAX protease family)